MKKEKSKVSRGVDGLQLTLGLALKVPLKECEPQSLMSAYALIPKKMFPLLSRFLLRHNLNFKLATLPGEEFAEKYLIRLNCGEKSSEPIPNFILSYIKNLPFSHLFQGFAGPEKKSLFLCEYGFKHPFDLAELVAEIAAAGLYISFAEERSCNSVIRPVPEFFPESSVLQYEVDFPLQQFDFMAQVKPEKLMLSLKFVDCNANLSSFAPVLFLEGREILWLKEMLYRLPGPLFTKVEWVGNQESLFLFFNDSVGSSFFPFGQPFWEITPNIFIPADKDIVPHLEPEQLQELFQVESDHYVFITNAWRRDLPVSVKAPLQELLMLAGNVKIEFKSNSDLDGFLWEDFAVEMAEDISRPAVEPSGITGNMPVIPVSEQLTNGGGVKTLGEGGDNNTAFINNSLNEYGVFLRQQGDFLGAATCFSLAKENLAAADCYAEAALALAGE